MQTLILPGYSKENKDWVDQVAQKLETKDTVRPFYWMHWTDETKKFDSQDKADLIAKHLRGESAYIIAKSLGTLVACKLIKLVPDKIEKVILCGIPLHDINSEDVELIKSSINSLKDKITIFQNDNDPHGSYEEVKDFGNVIKKESSDHNYPYFEDFNKILK